MSILYVTSFLVSYTLLLILMPLFANGNWQQTMHIGCKAQWNRKGTFANVLTAVADIISVDCK